MKYRFVSLAFALSIPLFLSNSSIVGSRDTGAQGGCFPGTYLVRRQWHSKPLDTVTRRRVTGYELRRKGVWLQPHTRCLEENRRPGREGERPRL